MVRGTRRSLGYARDDKGDGDASREWLLTEGPGQVESGMNNVCEVVITTITPNGSATLSFVSRAYPDFLQAAQERAACAVFCKENRMKIATPPNSTEIRVAGICSSAGPFLEML